MLLPFMSFTLGTKPKNFQFWQLWLSLLCRRPIAKIKFLSAACNKPDCAGRAFNDCKDRLHNVTGFQQKWQVWISVTPSDKGCLSQSNTKT